jgi:hypothetical protein
MPVPVNRPLQEWNLDCHIASASVSGATAGVAYVPTPFRGRLVRAYMCHYTTVSGGTANTVTVSINGTSVSGALISATTSANPLGYVYSATPTDHAKTYFNEGDVIGFAVDGGGADVTNPTTFTAVVRRV